MTQNQFKVTFSKGEYAYVFVCMFLIESGLIAMVFLMDHPLVYAVAAICFLPLFVFVVITTVLFYVKVDGTTIKVRTKRGKKYEFTCADINFVNCSKSAGGDTGTRFYIKITTKSHKLEIENPMKGFEQMAEYLLAKHESGDIRSIAVSERSKEWLHMYKNRDIYNRKKMKEYLMRKKSS